MASRVTRLALLARFALLAASLSGQTEKTLHNFNTLDGSSPQSGLTMDAAGNLYGTTAEGGTYGAGEVFELRPNGSGGWTETVLYSFTGGADGSTPFSSGVIFDSSGNLYGTTVTGGAKNKGAVFELSPAATGWSERVLYSFRSGNDGALPYAGLVFDPAGNLYGATYQGGHYSVGTVFELSPSGHGQWTEKVIHAFFGNDGEGPLGSLTIDSNGNLYGTTFSGGSHNYGVVYRITPSSTGTWTESVLHAFTGGGDGGWPNAMRPALDSSGSIFGTTQVGGAFGSGTVWRLYSAGGAWREQVLYSFEGNVADSPVSGVVFDAAGNLYGTCSNLTGGITSVGAVYELIRQSSGRWNGTILHAFFGADGAYPVGPVLLDAAGNLYGTTSLGGAGKAGVVFEITP
jgi:uncharacterized repeat protein (TIGR03803 family)